MKNTALAFSLIVVALLLSARWATMAVNAPPADPFQSAPNTSLANALSVEDMVHKSDLIAIGSCVETKSVWVGRSLVTLVTVSVGETIKGTEQNEIAVALPGGIDANRDVPIAMDFTDAEHPVEVAYFDRGPIDPKMLVLGGDWSAYWYNGHVYASEIARGLDIFELTPTKLLTQNEIDAANTVKFTELNVQNQQRFDWPKNLVVAKAYVDQLERSQALPADRIAALRQAIEGAQSAGMKGSAVSKLQKLAPSLEQTAGSTQNMADAMRLRSLAEILKKPQR